MTPSPLTVRLLVSQIVHWYFSVSMSGDVRLWRGRG